MAVKTYVTIDVQEEYMAAHLFGELDHHSVQSIREEIDRMAEQNEPTELILDFGGVTFMDSSGIAVVINALRSMTQIDGKLELTGIANQPMRVFRASGIDKLVEIKEAVS